MEALSKLLSGLVDMLLSIVNGVIVGTVTFVVNLLDGLDSIDSLVVHATSVIQGFSLLW